MSPLRLLRAAQFGRERFGGHLLRLAGRVRVRLNGETHLAVAEAIRDHAKVGPLRAQQGGMRMAII